MKKSKQDAEPKPAPFPWEPAEEKVTLYGRVRVKGGEGYAQIELNMSSEEALALADKKYRPERLDIVMRRMRMAMEVIR